MIVYKTTNLISGKCYIGQDTKDRPGYLGSGHYLKKAIEKYGKGNFQKETVAHCSSLERLDFFEKFCIARFHTKTPSGYNLNDGGGGSLNPSEDVRKRISESKKGKNRTPETIEKSRLGHLGRPTWMKGKRHTLEAIEKMSKAARRRRISEDGRKRLSEARMGNTNAKGSQRSEELRMRISKAMKGKPSPMKGKRHSGETRRKLSEAGKGKHPSEETRRKMSEALIGNTRMRGKYLSEETKIKISKTKRGHTDGRCLIFYLPKG